MRSSLRERLERLGPVRGVVLVESGSPATIVLRRGRRDVRSVAAAGALARRGVPLTKAKRAIESLDAQASAVLSVPLIESLPALCGELEAAGFAATQVRPADPVDVRDLRGALGLTREQFALRYGLDIDTVRHWERARGGRTPDLAALRFLQAIARDPEGMARLMEADARPASAASLGASDRPHPRSGG